MDNFLKAYLVRAEEIIGNRTSSEIAHDEAVIEALNQGKAFTEALNIAGTMFPDEAINYDNNNLDDLESHYDYIREHCRARPAPDRPAANPKRSPERKKKR